MTHQLCKERWLEMWGLAVIVSLYFYVRLAMWVAKKLADKREGKQWKWGVRAGVTLVFVLIPTGDSIVGHLYLNHLCSTEAGVKVYQTVELPAEYWDGQGKLKKEEFRLGEKYPLKYMSGAYFSALHVENSGYQLTEKETGKTMGEVVDFRYWGGWLTRNFSPHNTATSCDNQRGRFDELVGNIFKTATSIR
ncbi:MAG: hypothetical protein PHG89_11005 [Gallionella sp.]|nr:hypothetical protein [Gallionella sp.]